MAGTTWTIRTSAANNEWNSVTYGNGLFVAVASGLNGVMTSPDGITWTSQTSAGSSIWSAVTYGNGLFVAVSFNRGQVITSPDGITWTLQRAAQNYQWYSVTYGNGLFVAVSSDGVGNRVMTSPDGETWTLQSSAADNRWTAVTYSNDIFVAVAASGVGNRVMTSGQYICVLGSTKILMKDGTLKEIKDINIGEEILEDIDTNKTNIVSRVISIKVKNKKIVKIPKNTLNNNEDLYISEVHPIWINNDKNRILAKNIKGSESYIIEDDMLYNLQYDFEGTFYANGVKIDSLSPYHKYYSLPISLFVDKNNYIKDIKITSEDDKIRNKPKLINSY